MPTIPDVLKSNEAYLKSCILYEMLASKSASDCYQNFCKKLGADAMSYYDFDYWYYRFYGGEMDLNYDRSSDPTPISFSDMPVVVLKHIVKDLDPVERTPLRRISTVMNAVVDDVKSVYETFDLKLSESQMIMKVNKNTGMTYQNTENGCTVQKSNESGIRIEKSFLEKGFSDMTQALTIPKLKIDSFTITFSNPETDHSLIYSLPIGLHVKSLKIHGNSVEVVHLLCHFKPGALETICINTQGMGDTGMYVMQLEQWKQAKQVDISYGKPFHADHLPLFYHFERFEINVYGVCPIPIVYLLNALSLNPNFKMCHLKSGIEQNNIIAIMLKLGVEIEDEDIDSITHRQPIPNSNAFLKTEIRLDGIIIHRKTCCSKCYKVLVDGMTTS
ncbi:hypothetical protein GCK72_021720 [Caenorhabditis remanei]|uniref:F-box domain-containing protein n=1 Tax=Caenorhabditis remanei TaxID=31234 RepID=A0A6A5GKN5_CAERE|nr:hypothetical protein GCK72_021720 [Caenorhabditis remanei]KAF1755151.1 hypothetical protein GCK72_021720 [Caenorhabditis remanei]